MPGNLLERITINPEIGHGKPAVRNMRYTVSMILDLLSAGMTAEELIADYAALEKEDIQACLFYSSSFSETQTLYKIPA